MFPLEEDLEVGELTEDLPDLGDEEDLEVDFFCALSSSFDGTKHGMKLTS